MSRELLHAGGVFRTIHEAHIGAGVDLSDLDLARYAAPLVERAQRTWQERVRTEFRSIQIMSRFVTEVVGAGDPIEVYAGAVDMVLDEIRHTDLCASLCKALGAPAVLPVPVELRDPERFVASPMAERALATAISMLAINETISVAFVEDLRDRCDNPAVHRVLDATCADEQGHQDFGWAYVARSLERFPGESLPAWKHLVKTTLAPHRAQADSILAELSERDRDLDAHIEPELAALGLFSPVRQTLVFERCRHETLEPKLDALGLL